MVNPLAQASPANLPAGEWMFKLEGEVLGPVAAQEIFDRMMAGDVDESTMLRLGDGDWKSVQSLPQWHPFLHQARARIRAARAHAEVLAAARRRRMEKMINLGIGGVFLVLVSFAFSYMIIVQGPSRNAGTLKAWAERHIPVFGIPMANAAVLPSAGDADDGDDEEPDLGDINVDQILIDDAPALVAIKSGPTHRKRKRRKRRVPKPDKKPAAVGKDGKPGSQVASVGSLSNEEITKKVYARGNLNKLYACLRREIKSNPDLPGRVVLDFSIRNDGRIHKVQMDDARLENGSLHRCFARKLQGLKFRPFTGQVRNITIPFDWKK